MAKLRNTVLTVGQLIKQLKHFGSGKAVKCYVNTQDPSEGDEHDFPCDIEVMGIDIANEQPYCEIVAYRDNSDLLEGVRNEICTRFADNKELGGYVSKAELDMLKSLKRHLPNGCGELSLDALIDIYEETISKIVKRL